MNTSNTNLDFLADCIARGDDPRAVLGVAIGSAAQPFIDEHMQKVAHRVMDVFQEVDEYTYAEDIMEDVLAAIGILEAFGVDVPSRATKDIKARRR